MSTVETFDDNNNNKKKNRIEFLHIELSSITLTTQQVAVLHSYTSRLQLQPRYAKIGTSTTLMITYICSRI